MRYAATDLGFELKSQYANGYTDDAFAKLDYHAFTQTDAPPGKANHAGYDFSWQRLLHELQQQELLHIKP